MSMLPHAHCRSLSGKIVHDRHAGQMGSDGFAAGFGARRGFVLALRCGFEVDFGAEDLVQLGDRFRLVKELALSGCNAELLAARPVAIGLQDPKRLFQDSDAPFASRQLWSTLGVAASYLLLTSLSSNAMRTAPSMASVCVSTLLSNMR